VSALRQRNDLPEDIYQPPSERQSAAAGRSVSTFYRRLAAENGAAARWLAIELREAGAADQLEGIEQVELERARAQARAQAEAEDAIADARHARRRAQAESRHAHRAATIARIEQLDLGAWLPLEQADLEAARREVAALEPIEWLPPGKVGLARLEAELSPRVHVAIADGTGMRARAELERIGEQQGALAIGGWVAALAIGDDGQARRSLQGYGSDARRARGLAMLAVVFAEAERLEQRPGQCMLARIISPPGGYQECRECGLRHIGLRTVSHWDPNGLDSLDGDIGYLQALWLTGAITWHQWRDPFAIEQHCWPHEIGRSGFPVAHYTLAHAEVRTAAEVVERIAARDRASYMLALIVPTRPRLQPTRLAELQRAIAPP
jgi:hypothetical protein